MSRLFSQFVLTATVTAGAVALASTSAFAGSLTGATVSGNVIKYCVSGTQTVACPSTSAQDVLNGGGNIELAADTETTGTYGTLSTLSGQLDGKTITFSSLQESDWGFGNPTGLAKTWFNAAIAANGLSLTAEQVSYAYNLFSSKKGFQRTSDPNIKSVSRDTYGTGDITFDLAGHLNLNAALTDAINSLTGDAKTQALAFYNTKIGSKVLQASEVVKVTYDGTTQYLYSFVASGSGVTAADDNKSHNANYKLTINLNPDKKAVPEPVSLLGLVALAGLGWRKKQLQA